MSSQTPATDSGERLSAVAKRRKLNGNGANFSPVPVTVTVTESPAALSSTTKRPLEDENTFAALTDNHLADFLPAEDAVTVSVKTVVVRLPKDKKCLISGVYRIWIRKGAVTINGAILAANSPRQTVFAPESYEIAPIVGISSQPAELEIRTVYGVYPKIFGFRSYIWTTSQAARADCSFIVHDMHRFPPGHVRTPRELDTSSTSSARASLRTSASSSSTKPPVVVFSGLRTQGMSAHISTIVNEILVTTESNGQRKYPDGVLFFDLDSVVPEFGPPGTISLVLIKKYILGPSFTHPAQRGSDDHNLLAMSWVGAPLPPTAQESMVWLFSRLVLTEFEKHKATPLIIRACDRLQELSYDILANITNLFDPTHVFSLRTSRYTGHDVSGYRIATVAHIAPMNITIPTGSEPSLIEQHDMLIQSHFQARPQSSRTGLLWTMVPPVFQLQDIYVKELKYDTGDNDGEVTGIWLNPLVHDPERLEIDLKGSMVAITLEPQWSEVAKLLPSDIILTEQYPVSLSDKDFNSSITGVAAARRASVSRIPYYTRDENTKQERECLALGIIKEINTVEHKLAIGTPLAVHELRACTENGRTIHIHIIAPDAQGRFSTNWAYEVRRT